MRAGGPGLISTVLLSREPQDTPGTSEGKVGVLRHPGPAEGSCHPHPGLSVCAL